MQYLHDDRNRYPLTEQTTRRNIQTQAGKKEKSKYDLKAAAIPNKKFLQSKQTKPRFIGGVENTVSLTNLNKI